MKILSIQVGLPREINWRGKTITTSIYKDPVTGPVTLRRHNLDGDKQSDPEVHGGPTKAVYAYPSEHYSYWREELPDMDLPFGIFGENLTTEGLDEESVHIGDVYRIGTARLIVTEPRMPCYKLGIRFGRPDMVKRFLQSQRSGFYFGVAEEGTLQAGDRLERSSTTTDGINIADVVRLQTTDKDNAGLLKKAVATAALPTRWRDKFAQRLNAIGQ